jgi:ABC-type glutathione transport system ATPase component
MVLYLGRVMEEAPTPRLFAEARHPYTRALLAATRGTPGLILALLSKAEAWSTASSAPRSTLKTVMSMVCMLSCEARIVRREGRGGSAARHARARAHLFNEVDHVLKVRSRVQREGGPVLVGV